MRINGREVDDGLVLIAGAMTAAYLLMAICLIVLTLFGYHA